MRTHVFSGATSREVLQKVKQTLGDDALILSNRAVADGIEVVALTASDADTVATAPVQKAAAVQSAPARRAVEALPRAAAAVVSAPAAQSATALAGTAQSTSTLAGAVHTASAPAQENGSIEGILSEIQNLKSMLQQEIAAFGSLETRPSTVSSPVLQELTNAGFTPQLVRRLGLESSSGQQSLTIARATARLQSELKLGDADEVIDRGGIYALVGPTGVGKTTTVAKLAARCVVRFGASKVALLTSDGYRIGAHDQLRIYARILGVTAHAVRDASGLARALAELSDRHLVLIDTIGMSQRDSLLAEQAAMLSSCGGVKRLLLVQSTLNTATLDQVISAYKQGGIEGYILTKTDEAASLAPALDAVIRHELPVHYVTDGQRVPEDLQLPDAGALVREALQPSESVLALTPEEIPLVMQPRAAAPMAEMSAVAEGLLPKVVRRLGRHEHARVVHG